MQKFIYVFNEKDKEKLMNSGFVLLKNDTRNSLFVLAVRMDDNFSFELLDGISEYSISDTLTF